MSDKQRQLADLGAQIFSARTAARLTQAALAQAVSVAPNTIARVERGEMEPGALLIGRLAQALRVSADQLLSLRA